MLEDNTQETIKGQPGLVILPAKMYEMKVIADKHTCSVPMSGKFSELYADFFEETGKTEESDVFESLRLYDGKDCIESVSIIELLFAARLYPDLKDNQIFSVGSILVDKETNMLHITGSVLELLN